MTPEEVRAHRAQLEAIITEGLRAQNDLKQLQDTQCPHLNRVPTGRPWDDCLDCGRRVVIVQVTVEIVNPNR